MTIFPLSGASWPAKQPAVEDAHCSHLRRREMPSFPSSSHRGFPRQWELRKSAIFPVLQDDGDYWSDASLSMPHLAAALPEVEEKESLPSAVACSENGDGHYRPRSLIHGPAAKPIRARCADFPPPLDSPAHLLCEGRFQGLQSVAKACFTSVRSNGRLLMTEVPTAAKPRLHLRAERRHGRLLIQLHVESSAAGEQPLAAAAAGREEQDDGCSLPMEEACQAAAAENSAAQEVDEAASHALFSEDDDDGDEGREDKASGRDDSSLQKIALQTLVDGDGAFTDLAESHRPIQIQCKYGRSDRPPSFLHKSFIRARPLHMLSIWQQTQALSLTEVLHPCLLKG